MTSGAGGLVGIWPSNACVTARYDDAVRLLSLLPREHGAYGQMAIPIVTALATAGVNAPAMLTAAAVAAMFLAHEPLLVLLGRRGARARREQSRAARLWLSTTAGIAIAAGTVALWQVPPAVRTWFVLPLIPAVLLVVAIVANREKSLLAEVAVALVFSLAAVPLCLAARASPAVGIAIGLTFSAVFVTATLAVRAILLQTRGGGDRRAARSSRRAALALAAAVVIGLYFAAVRSILPWSALIAAAPGLAGASWLAAFPPPPVRLRTVGWTIVVTSAASAMLLVATLRGSR